ncbi:hypothetical protein JCM1393_08890 [Clostridium carnis]
MSNMKNNNKVNVAAIGNYTKGAVETFEENIVNKTNYLEEVDANLKDNKN